MKKHLILAAACLAASLAQAAPPIPLGQLQLRVTVRPCAAPGVGLVGNSMYNCRFFDGSIYAPQINFYCWARFPRGSSTPTAAVLEDTRQTRMVSPFRGAYSSTYLLASSGSLTKFTRYNFDGSNPVDAADFPDGEKCESFDWVNDNTIICTDYGSNKKRLYLLDVTADPFVLTKNITWNADGYVTTGVSTRIRNVRVGQTDPNFAYYGDAGVSDNPKVYAIDLRTGASTELGHWNGVLRAGATGSFGLWTVVERGGYLYLQTSDDGIQVYSMTGPTTMGSMVASYSPAQLQSITGGGSVPYYGFDVAADDAGLILGDFLGNVFELQRRGAPITSGQWQHNLTVRPFADNPPQLGNSTYNPRYFDGNIYATELSDPTYRCFAYYSGSGTLLGGGIPYYNEHRMLGRLRGTGGATYLMGTGGWDGAPGTPQVIMPTFTEYDASGNFYGLVNSIDDQVVETFDWVDDDTIICNDYTSGNRRRVYLTDVTAEPFGVTRNTTWNADGYVTTDVSTRIRNVRVGQMYSGYAYYGDAGNDNNPNFYAIDLATGNSTLLGNAGTLSHVGTSFGLWTVIERGGYLYVQTTDNGIQVYNMINATTLGSLYTTYTKAELDAATGVATIDQYYGMDLSPDGTKMLLGAPFGSVYELAPACRLGVSRSGTNVILSWPATYTGVVVESSTDLSAGCAAMSPQPTVVRSGNFNTATIPVSGAQYFRLSR